MSQYKKWRKNRDKDLKYHRDLYKTRRELGLCGMCGKVETEEFANCIDCRRKTSIRTNRSLRKKKKEEENVRT